MRKIHPPILVVAGMEFEARAARGLDVKVVYGQHRLRLEHELSAIARSGVSGVVSFGTAGGLAPDLAPGAVLVAQTVLSSRNRYHTSEHWTNGLLKALPHAHAVTMFASDTLVATPVEKSALWRETGAAAVDMESHLAAEVARCHGLDFAVLRVVIDPAHRALPPAAIAGMRPDGKSDPFAVMMALCKKPRELPGLLQLARDARAANRAMVRSRRALGPLFGLLDAHEPQLNASS